MKRSEQAVDFTNDDLQYIWNASQTVLLLDAIGFYHDLEFRDELINACLHNSKVVEIASKWTREQSLPVRTQSPKGLYILNGAAHMAVLASLQMAQAGQLDNSLGKEEVAVLIPKLEALAEKLKEGDMMYIEPYMPSELN